MHSEKNVTAVGECDCGRWAGTKPIRPATNSSFNTLNSTTWCRVDHFFTVVLVFEVLETPARELIEANCHARRRCSKQLLNDVICIYFSDKTLFTLAEQFTEWPTVSICCNKEYRRRSKMLSSHTATATVTDNCSVFCFFESRCSFIKYCLIFKMHSLANTAVILQWSGNYRSHHTSDASPHYLEKYFWIQIFYLQGRAYNSPRPLAGLGRGRKRGKWKEGQKEDIGEGTHPSHHMWNSG